MYQVYIYVLENKVFVLLVWLFFYFAIHNALTQQQPRLLPLVVVVLLEEEQGVWAFTILERNSRQSAKTRGAFCGPAFV